MRTKKGIVMKAYGSTKKFWCSDDYPKNDKILKRILHKKGRSQGKKEILSQLG